MRLLFVQFKRLGDVLMVTPAVKALKVSYPQSTLHFLVEKTGLPAIQHHPLVDRVIVGDNLNWLELVRTLRTERYDAAVDFQGSPRSARWTWLSGAKMRVGFPKRGRTMFYNNRISPPHSDTYSAEQKLSLLAPFQISSRGAIPELYASPAETQRAKEIMEILGMDKRQRVVAFSPVSRRQYNRWPAEHYSAVCDHLHRRRQLLFLPLYGPGEAHFIEEVIARTKHPEAFLYPYSPISFGSLKLLIDHCCLYFGNDNGIRHVAVACGKPTATIFGPINPLNWTPHGNGLHCYLGGQENIAAITPSQAIEMISELLPLATS